MHAILAENHGSRILQHLHAPRRLLLSLEERRVGVVLHAVMVDISLDIDIILDTNGHAVQNAQRLAGSPSLCRRLSSLKDQFVVAVVVGPGVSIPGLGPYSGLGQREEGVDDVKWGCFARLVELVIVVDGVVPGLGVDMLGGKESRFEVKYRAGFS